MLAGIHEFDLFRNPARYSYMRLGIFSDQLCLCTKEPVLQHGV